MVNTHPIHGFICALPGLRLATFTWAPSLEALFYFIIRHVFETEEGRRQLHLCGQSHGPSPAVLPRRIAHTVLRGEPCRGKPAGCSAHRSVLIYSSPTGSPEPCGPYLRKCIPPTPHSPILHVAPLTSGMPRRCDISITTEHIVIQPSTENMT